MLNKRYIVPEAFDFEIELPENKIKFQINFDIVFLQTEINRFSRSLRNFSIKWLNPYKGINQDITGFIHCNYNSYFLSIWSQAEKIMASFDIEDHVKENWEAI